VIEQLHRINKARPSAEMDQGSSVGDESATPNMHHPGHREGSIGAARPRRKRRKTTPHALAGPDGISGSKTDPARCDPGPEALLGPIFIQASSPGTRHDTHASSLPDSPVVRSRAE
jgi:hypothetical protein